MYTPMSYLEQLYSLITRHPISLELKGSTRGRGSNPSKGKLSTDPSNQPLQYLSRNPDDVLNLRKLILSYRPYFGLLMSKLYTCPSVPLSPSYKTPLSYSPKSLLGILAKFDKRSTRSKKQSINFRTTFTIYTCGSKCNALLLNASFLSSTFSSLYIKRIFKRNN